jgi:hypothetical protein
MEARVPASAPPPTPEPDPAAAPADPQPGDLAAVEATGAPADPTLVPYGPALRPESLAIKAIATVGVVAIGTAIGAVLVANDVAGWIVGLVVAAIAAVLSGGIWGARRR